MMIELTPIVSRSKTKQYKAKKVKKIASNSQLQAVQILSTLVQKLVLYLSYFITTVKVFKISCWYSKFEPFTYQILYLHYNYYI